MSRLPPPGTFAEGQRYIYGLLASAGGIFCGACAVATVALLMWGGWSPSEEHTIVLIFGWSLRSPARSGSARIMRRPQHQSRPSNSTN